MPFFVARNRWLRFKNTYERAGSKKLAPSASVKRNRLGHNRSNGTWDFEPLLADPSSAAVHRGRSLCKHSSSLRGLNQRGFRKIELFSSLSKHIVNPRVSRARSGFSPPESSGSDALNFGGSNSVLHEVDTTLYGGHLCDLGYQRHSFRFFY